MKKINVYRLATASLMLAVGIVLPVAFHLSGTSLGQAILPMHLPVLLCGLLCGPAYGAGVGAVLPFISLMLTGRPSIWPGGISMTVELLVYGVVSGLLSKLLFRLKDKYLWSILSVVPAMICGRAAYGIFNFIVYGLQDIPYTMPVFLTGAFITSLPGIAIQLVIIPLVVSILNNIGTLQKIR